MALINCPECGKEVSNQADKCPNCGVIIKKAKRSFIGKLFKCAFIIFNLIMAIFLFSIYDRAGMIIGDSGQMPLLVRAVVQARVNNALFLWAVGCIVLGMLVFFTRPKNK